MVQRNVWRRPSARSPHTHGKRGLKTGWMDYNGRRDSRFFLDDRCLLGHHRLQFIENELYWPWPGGGLSLSCSGGKAWGGSGSLCLLGVTSASGMLRADTMIWTVCAMWLSHLFCWCKKAEPVFCCFRGCLSSWVVRESLCFADSVALAAFDCKDRACVLLSPLWLSSFAGGACVFTVSVLCSKFKEAVARYQTLQTAITLAVCWN